MNHIHNFDMKIIEIPLIVKFDFNFKITVQLVVNTPMVNGWEGIRYQNINFIKLHDNLKIKSKQYFINKRKKTYGKWWQCSKFRSNLMNWMDLVFISSKIIIIIKLCGAFHN